MIYLLLAIFLTLVTSLILVGLRLRVVLDRDRPKPKRGTAAKNGGHGDRKAHLLIVLGSGGHTAEMIAMLERACLLPSSSDSSSSPPTPSPSNSGLPSGSRKVSSLNGGLRGEVDDGSKQSNFAEKKETNRKDDRLLDWSRFTRRTWVVSAGDALSASRAKAFEEKMANLRETTTTKTDKSPGIESSEDTYEDTYEIAVVPRARKIHQPIWTAPWSSLACMRACFSILLSLHPFSSSSSVQTGSHKATTKSRERERNIPDLILCNGPATATILIVTSIIIRFFNFSSCHSRGKFRTIYIESWARVKNLSLSGKILKFLVDRFLVQWPQLVEREGSRVEFIGVLV